MIIDLAMIGKIGGSLLALGILIFIAVRGFSESNKQAGGKKGDSKSE